MTPFHYALNASWPSRPETAAAIAGKYLDMINRLQAISPLFQNWILLAEDRETQLNLSDLEENLISWVESNVARDEGEPFPANGFRLRAASNHGPAGFDMSKTPSLSITAGSRFRNTIDLDIGNLVVAADPEAIDCATFEKALLAIVSVWGCTWGSVRLSPQVNLNARIRPGPVPSSYNATGPWRPGYGMSWMAYLSAPRTQGLAVPYELETERLADGGMFLSTAEALMDPGNPQHIAMAGLLSDILEQRGGDPLS